MLKIDYPQQSFRLKKTGDKEFVFDVIRKKWIIITPEEWVRQNFLQYLITVKNYPASLLSVEKVIVLGELKKRCDIVVYKNDLPWMIIECKEKKIVLDEAVLQQALRYNMSLKVNFLVLTNGNMSLGLEIIDGKICEIQEIPAWK